MNKQMVGRASWVRLITTATLLALGAASVARGRTHGAAASGSLEASRAQLFGGESLANASVQAGSILGKAPQQATATSTPGSDGTPSPEPTAEVREFEGHFGAAFEQSLFIEGTERCPQDTSAWWLMPDKAFTTAYDQLRAHRDLLTPGGPAYETTPYIVRVRFRGGLSRPGAFGHLGSYKRAIKVHEFIEMEDTPLCGMDLADVGISSLRWRWSNELPSGCLPGRPEVLELDACLANRGRQTALDFWAEIPVMDGPATRVRVCGLRPGEVRCLPRFPMTRGTIRLDPGHEVEERFRRNNSISFSAPTMTPPPRCTAVPEGQPTPKPPPSPTPWTCATPTPTELGSRLFVPLGLR